MQDNLTPSSWSTQYLIHQNCRCKIINVTTLSQRKLLMPQTSTVWYCDTIKNYPNLRDLLLLNSMGAQENGNTSCNRDHQNTVISQLCKFSFWLILIGHFNQYATDPTGNHVISTRLYQMIIRDLSKLVSNIQAFHFILNPINLSYSAKIKLILHLKCITEEVVTEVSVMLTCFYFTNRF
jgi:hypothetical protein